LDTKLPDELENLLIDFWRSSEAILEEFKRPWGSSPAPDIIYHYTNDVGLSGILESGKIWLNDLFQMNDPSELRHGVEHAIELTKAIAQKCGPEMQFFADHFNAIRKGGIERSAHYFIASFSSNGDELGQWRAYADDGHGFALGFDGCSFEQGFARADDSKTAGIQTFPLFYDNGPLRAVQEKIVALVEPLMLRPSGRGFSEQILREYMRRLTVEFSVAVFHSAIYFKYHAYKAEDEYRFLSIQRGDRPPVGALSRSRPYGLIRYIEYDWRSVVPGALKHIMIGPAADEDKARTFVNMCLDVFGYDPQNIVVRKSPIPYRSLR
jgi:hypothetical protein